MYFDAAYAPFGEPYAQSGTTDLSFTGQNQDTVGGGLTGLYDFPAREYSTQGRWPSPDPAGLGAVLPENPQTWNRYAYVLNNPLNLIDPLGRDCVYLLDSGDGVESIDTSSNFSECSANGGFWADGTIIGIGFDPNSDNVNLLSWQTDANGNIQYGWTQAGTLTGTGTSGTWSSITQWAPSGADVPLNSFAAAVFAQVYQQSNAVADPKFIATWYGASAAIGALGSAPALWGIGVNAYNTVYSNLVIWQAGDLAGFTETVNILMGMIGGSAVPGLPGTPGTFIGKGINCLASGRCKR